MRDYVKTVFEKVGVSSRGELVATLFAELALSPVGVAWIGVEPGDVFHVPGHAKHAWRDPGREPAVMTIVTTARIGRFFREVAAPTGGDEPAAAVRRLLETSERYGYGNATPEEHAAVGLALPGTAPSSPV